MTDVLRLLHPTDFSEAARTASRYAVLTAARLSAELHVVHVTRTDTRGGERSPMNSADAQLESRMRHAVSEAAGEIGVDELNVEYGLVRDRSAAAGILRCASERDVDAIIMGMHGRRGFRRFILGSVAARVLHEAPCDVVVVPQRAKVEEAGRILAPVDLFGRSPELIAWSVELADQLKTGVDVLYVIDTSLLLMPTVTAGRTPPARTESIADVVRRRLRDLVEPVRQQADVRTFIKQGHPAREILNFANDRESAFVMLASSGITTAERALLEPEAADSASDQFMLGSITERVATHAGVPVWVRKKFAGEKMPPREYVHEVEMTAS